MKKRSRKSLIFVLVLIAAVISLTVFIKFRNGINDKNKVRKLTAQETQQQFDEFINNIFINEVTCDSVTLNFTIKDKDKYGIEDIEPALGTVGMEEMQNSIFISENRMAALEEFDYDNLTYEQKLIYDIIYNILRVNMDSSEVLEYAETLGPTSGIQAQLPIFLSEYNFYTESDIETYFELLKLVPEYFDSIIKFEQKKSEDGLFMSDVTAQAIIKQCQDFIKSDENCLVTVFDRRIDEFEGINDDKVKEYKNQNRKLVQVYVIKAYEKLIDALTELKGTGKNEGGLCGFKKGKKYYEYLVKAKTGSYRGIRKINRMLEEQIAISQKEIASIMTENPNAYYSAQDIKYPYDNPEETIGYLREAVKKDFGELPASVLCDIKYVDKSMEASLSPAFYLTPCIDSFDENVMYLNGYEKYDLSQAFSTIAHESYPGHLFQNCYFNNTKPNPVRSVIHVGGYSEGWATYAEIYSYSYAGLNKDVKRLMQENTVATLCIYGKADIGVNYYGWDFNKLQEYLSGFGFSKSQSKTIYDSMVAEPANYLQYIVGYLEIEELKETAQEDLGDKFQIRDFHRFILETGPAPFSVIEERLDEYVDGMYN